MWHPSMFLILLIDYAVSLLIRSTHNVVHRIPGTISLDLKTPSTILSKACIFINVTKCSCTTSFKDLQSFNMDLPQQCLLSNASFWFTVQIFNLTNPGIPSVSSKPIFIPSLRGSLINTNTPITLVLCLTVSDLLRADVLMMSLLVQHQSLSNSPSIVHEMLVIVPDNEALEISKHFTNENIVTRLRFQTIIVPESALFDNGGNSLFIRSKYALQMALKLLASKLIHTPYFITLDADVVLLRPLKIELILNQNGQGYYQPEARSIHLDWWLNSSMLLGLQDQFDPNGLGFGVTPAVMSTYGGLEVIEALNQRFLDFPFDAKSVFVTKLLSLYGVAPQLRWTEYTIYRLVLDRLNLFDLLHTPELNESKLHCNDVWNSNQLPWDYNAAIQSRCVFSVIQSTAVSGAAAIMQLRNQFMQARVEL